MIKKEVTNSPRKYLYDWKTKLLNMGQLSRGKWVIQICPTKFALNKSISKVYEQMKIIKQKQIRI